MSSNKKKKITISLLILIVMIVLIGITYAFIQLTLTGTRNVVLTAGTISLELQEDENNLTITDALPMFDEVGMIKEPFTFRLINSGSFTANYVIKLAEIGTGTLAKTDVKYGLTKDGERTIDLVSNIVDGVIDSGTILGEQTINYTLRLWIRDDVTNIETIQNRTLSLKFDVEAEASEEPTIPDTTTLVEVVKQGDYIAYEGNNGCLRNGTSITGSSDAENGNSCLGYNANANTDGSKDTDNDTYGYCYSASYKYDTSGWRIAYTDSGRAYIISAGSPECNTRTASKGNATYIAEANSKAKKYCNFNFVDDCTSDTDVHAINNTDFNKMTAQTTGTTGGYLFTEIEGATMCGGVQHQEVCGYNNDLLDNGGYYWFATAYTASSTYGVSWSPDARRVNGSTSTNAYGLRPVIRLSSDVYVTGGSGIPEDPYTIAR